MLASLRSCVHRSSGLSPETENEDTGSSSEKSSKKQQQQQQQQRQQQADSRVRKAVSFKAHGFFETSVHDDVRGGAPLGAHVEWAEKESFSSEFKSQENAAGGSPSRDVSTASRRQASCCDATNDVSSSAASPFSISISKHPTRRSSSAAAAAASKRDRRESNSNAHHTPPTASSGDPLLHRPLTQRFVSAFLAPFRELGGGELNFAWAYKEASAIRQQSLTSSLWSYKSCRVGSQKFLASRRFSSRLSEATANLTPELHRFPLRFRDKEAEREYVAVTNYQLSLRLSVFLIMQHCVLLPTQFSLFFADPNSRLGSLASNWFVKPLIIAFVGVSVVALLLAVALLYPCVVPLGGGIICRKYAGQLACLYCLVVRQAGTSNIQQALNPKPKTL